MDPKRKIIITGGIGLVLIIGFGALALYPLVNNIIAESQSLQSKRADLAVRQEEQQNISLFQAFANSHMSEFDQLDALLIDAETPVEFIKYLEATGTAYNFNLVISAHPPAQDKGDAWTSMQFKIGGKGTYSDFMRMLTRLENSPYLIWVKEVTVQAPDIAPHKPGTVVQPNEIIDFSVSFKVFAK